MAQNEKLIATLSKGGGDDGGGGGDGEKAKAKAKAKAATTVIGTKPLEREITLPKLQKGGLPRCGGFFSLEANKAKGTKGWGTKRDN